MTIWSVLADIVVILAVAFGAWRGYRDGAIAACANLVGLAVSLLAAYWLYKPVAGLLLHFWAFPQSIANLLGFLAIAFILDSVITTAVLLAAVRIHPQALQNVWMHRLGIVPGALNSAVMVGYLASLVLAMPVEHPFKQAVDRSLLAKPMAETVNRLWSPAGRLVQPALNDLSQLFTVEPGSKEIVTLPFKVQNPQLDEADEEAMLDLVNRERTSRGIGALTMDESLRRVGRAHSLDMFQRGYFSHYTPEGKDPFDRMAAAGITYQAAGENLALAPTLQMAHTGLMNSPGHRRNILDPSFHKIGIGAYKDPRYGIIFSQEFTN